MKIISFFSYKGGAGRSTLAYNTIPVLAKDFIHPTKEHPFIILDMDIDSCGMTYLCNAKEKATKENCVQTLLANLCSRRTTPTIAEHPVLGKFLPVGNAYGYEENEAILLVPAFEGKRIDEQSFDSNYNGGDNPLAAIMRTFISCCEKMKVSAVMFDSSVGDNLTAVVSNNLANIIVCCMRPTRQFREGTVGYLQRISNNHIGVGKNIIVVPNVVPTRSAVIDDFRYPDEAVYQIGRAFREFKDSTAHNYHLDLLDKDSFGIPALDRFMWREDILRNVENRTPEEELVLSRYTKLASIINSIDPDASLQNS